MIHNGKPQAELTPTGITGIIELKKKKTRTWLDMRFGHPPSQADRMEHLDAGIHVSLAIAGLHFESGFEP